jgi:cytochrome c oxidase subunit 3
VSLAIAFGAVIAGIIVWGILVRNLSARSWETAGPVVELNAYRHAEIVPARLGLWIFLAVVTSLFGLFITAYYMRMSHSHGGMSGHSDWISIPKPTILWLNTVCLVASSIAMQWARLAVSKGSARATRLSLAAGGTLTLVFLIGQLAAWAQVHDSPFFSPSNPAVAFFYVLTAIHGAHLLGGLYVWGRTLIRLGAQRVSLVDSRLTVELCSVYWHYLLLVWLVLFGLLSVT